MFGKAIIILSSIAVVLASPLCIQADSSPVQLGMTGSEIEIEKPFPLRKVIKDTIGDTITETFPQPVLTAKAEQAIAASPSWLAESLTIAFSALDDLNQDLFAGTIIHATNPDYRDEIAFCVAHILTNTLTHNQFDYRLLEENVQWIYDLDTHLQHVRLVEYGDSSLGGTDYYTTTAYIIDEGSGPFEMEIPRDVYYWWIVHPAVTNERPTYVNPETAQAADPANGGFFWRKYFWESDTVYDYRTNGDWVCNLMADVAVLPTFLWDRQVVSLPSGREFTADCSAMDIVSNWVLDVMHWGAQPPRPSQPVALAYDHNGNCGEYQDFLGAAIRTALIPANGTHTTVDDHVWNEFWDEGWVPIGDSDHTSLGSYGNGADYTYGGWKDISAAYALRGDGLEINRTASYTDSCTVTISVTDENGVPIDSALVKILGQSYYNPDNFGTCITACTDSNGVLVMPLGDNRDFKAEVYTDIGVVGTTLIVEDTVAGETYPFAVTVPGSLDVPKVTDAGTPPLDSAKWQLYAEVQVTGAIQYGLKKPPTGGSLIRTFQEPVDEGSVDVMLMDVLNKNAWDADEPFKAYYVSRETSDYHQAMAAMNDNSWVFAVSNRHSHGHRQIVDIHLILEEFTGTTWEVAESLTRTVSLDPGEVYTAEFGEGLFNMSFDLPGEQFTEGDEFYVNLDLDNTTSAVVDADVYVLLEAYGVFYGYPAWQEITQGLTPTAVSIPVAGSDSLTIMPAFTMPAVPTSGPYYFYSAAFEPGTLDPGTLLGNVDVAGFTLVE